MEIVLTHVPMDIPMYKVLVKDAFLHVLNALVDHLLSVLIVLKTSSSTLTLEFVNRTLPATSDKKKSMEGVKEFVKQDTSTKMELVSLENVQQDSKTMVSEDVLYHQPIQTDVKFLLSDLMEFVSITVEILSSLTVQQEHVMLVQTIVKHVCPEISVSLVRLVSLQ